MTVWNTTPVLDQNGEPTASDTHVEGGRKNVTYIVLSDDSEAEPTRTDVYDPQQASDETTNAATIAALEAELVE